ncbi:ecto-ADP-ribosyltransferase 4 isoform X1 [Esox lucius]|uniref:ecto-ADP-ribosyltransferase 4 isoform X1 n=1 Tax=Esox lucius TaxID=8010 RepID=UPI00147764D8|nr:ecto-ADP-ribosyltransferase 4 isoform X1 [Esox lucius]
MKYITGVLLLLATITAKVNSGKQCQCKCDEERLDREPSSVDDRYATCREEMMGNITNGDLLSRELQADPSFADAWLEAGSCNRTVANLTKLHITALSVYTNENRTFPEMFDTDTRSFGPDVNVYRRYFPYKSLHFLLTDALRLLRAGNEAESDQEGTGCLLVYTRSRRSGDMQGEVGDPVRIGHFILASTRRYSASFDLTIRTCHGTILPQFTSLHCRSYSGLNVLVPPYELFRVAAVKKGYRKWENDMAREFYLESIGTLNTLNCAMTSVM